jgi:hypothetical protein
VVVTALQILTMKAKNAVDNLCRLKKKAEIIVERCENKYIPYDGEYLKNMVIIDGVGAATAAALDTSGCFDEYKTIRIPEDETDTVCRQTLDVRKHPAGATINGRVYASGGYSTLEDFGDDVWFRGA